MATLATKDQPGATSPAAGANELPDYVRVIFGPRGRDPLDTERVEIGANGLFLMIEREKEITLPKVFLMVARDGVHTRYRWVPGEDRQIESKSTTYPCTYLGPGNEADFRSMLEAGNKEMSERYGRS